MDLPRTGHRTGHPTGHPTGHRWNVILEPFRPLSEGERQAIAEEADRIAPLRDAQTTTLSIED
jgi:hypothetical protein